MAHALCEIVFVTQCVVDASTDAKLVPIFARFAPPVIAQLVERLTVDVR